MEEIYQRIKQKHPDWNDERIWAAASLEMQADVVFYKHEDASVNDPDIMQMIIRGAMEWLDKALSVNDPDIMQMIIRGAMEWLDKALPIISERVKDLFANLLQNMATWIRKGWEYVMQIISNSF